MEEDDGWTEGDYQGSPEEQEKQAQEDWEDAGRPGEKDNDDDDDNDNDPNPYCDKVGNNYQGSCHDRKDYSETTGLYFCNDGTQKTDWRDCKDATEDDNVGEKHEDEVLLDSQSCYDEGYNDGQNGPFNNLTHSHCNDGIGANDYYIGFRLGCTNAGNTIDVCESATDA